MKHKIKDDHTPATIKTAAFFASLIAYEIAVASIKQGALWHEVAPLRDKLYADMIAEAIELDMILKNRAK